MKYKPRTGSDVQAHSRMHTGQKLHDRPGGYDNNNILFYETD